MVVTGLLILLEEEDMAKKRKARARRKTKSAKRRTRRSAVSRFGRSVGSAVDIVLGAARDSNRMGGKMKRRVAMDEG